MTHILSNFPEEYQTMVEILEDELYDKNVPLTIERIRGIFLMKLEQMNKQSRPRYSTEDKKALYLQTQYKGTCTTCGIHGHKGKYCWQKESSNLSKCYYCDKPRYDKKYCRNIIKEKNQESARTKVTRRKAIISK